MKFSDKIKFNSYITKEKFTKFMQAIKDNDPKTYAEEMVDGCADLYRYWSKLGYRRFMAKYNSNVRRWNIKE